MLTQDQKETFDTKGLICLKKFLPRKTVRTAQEFIFRLAEDVPRQPHADIPGVQMFTFLEPVRPRGGGTLVVAGSHRLVNDGTFIRSKDVRTHLKKYAYFQTLLSKEPPDSEHFLTTPGEAGGVELQVVELQGEPGDVVLMDLRLRISTNDNIRCKKR